MKQMLRCFLCRHFSRVLLAPRHEGYSMEMNLIALYKQFGNDEKCRQYLEALRWPKGVKCPRCESEKIARLTSGPFECGSCGYQFSVTVGTIFQDSHLPL